MVYLTKIPKPRLAVLLLALLAVLSLGATEWELSRERVEGNLRAALQRDTAYTLERFGPARFRALPWPTLVVTDLELKKQESSTERASVRHMRARINLASWLTGHPRIVEMRIANAQIHLAATDKLAETEAVSTAMLNFLRQGDRPDLRLLRVTDVQIFRDGKPWVEDLLINVHNVATQDMRLRVRASYQGHQVNLRAEVAQGSSSFGRAVRWDIGLPGLQSHFEGRLFGSRSFDAEGVSKTSIANGSQYARGLGLSTDLARLFNRLAIEGETRVTWPSVMMRQARLGFDQNSLDGSLEFSFDTARPAVSATLGTSTLDLNSRIEAWSGTLPDQTGAWSEETVTPDWLHAGQADIRLSAEKVLLGAITLEKVALASQLREGRLDVILSQAHYKSGQFRGRGQMRQFETGLEIRGSMTFDQIDLESLQRGFGFQRIKGLASGQISLEARGTSPKRLMQSNSGKGNLTIRNGEFVGLDIERLMTRLDRSIPIVIAPSGRTRFRTLSSEFALSSGIVKLMPTQISTFGLNAPVEGTIDLNQQAFDLTIRLVPVLSIPRLGGAAIRAIGPWSKPALSTEWATSSERS